MDKLTILIPTSPIPSHPSTEIIDDAISKIRVYTDAQIIIMFDGVHTSLEHRRSAYKEYLFNVEDNIDVGNYGRCRTLLFNVHEHQARMTRKALESVSTPLIMFCEHDCAPIGDIPFHHICETVEHERTINYMRFNIFDRILEEHNYLMLTSSITSLGIPYTRTIQYSQRPHIAKTDWYRDILTKYFKPEDKTMIEDVMHGVVIEGHKITGEDFGLAIYTPPGNQLRSYHSDGRGSDEKITYG